MLSRLISGTILAAVTPVPDTLSEYQFAGLLRGRKVKLVHCKTVPLKIPAETEIVIEGHVMLDEFGDEGPYGDHTGYYNAVEPFPVFRVSAITLRRDPIYLSTFTGRPPDEPSVLGQALNEVFIPLLIQQFPEIVDFWLPPEGCSYRIAVVSIRKAYPGHAKRVMMGVWSFLRQFIYTKFVIVVDDDINARDWKDVMWAISTRMDPARDITVIEGTPIDYLDFASPESGLGGKLGLDATNKWPPETHRDWGTKIRMTDEVIDEVTRKWASYGLPGSGEADLEVKGKPNPFNLGLNSQPTYTMICARYRATFGGFVEAAHSNSCCSCVAWRDPSFGPKLRSNIPSSAIPRDEINFTRFIAEAINATHPSHEVRVIAPLTLKSQYMQINLDRIFIACRNNGDHCEEFSNRFILGIVDALRISASTPRPEELRVVIRPTDYVLANLAKIPIAEIFPLTMPAGLSTLLYFDQPKAMRTATTTDLAAMHLSLEQAYNVALKNTAAEIQSLKSVAQDLPPQGIGILPSDAYESSRMVMHSEWSELASKLHDHLIVAVPSAEEVLYAEGSNPIAVDALYSLAKNQYMKAERPISPSVFEWHKDKWEHITP